MSESIAVFEREPYRRELATEVVALGEESGRPTARTERTLFYPEGGGQPADRGRLGDAEVLDVQRRREGIVHLLDRPAALGPVTLVLDWNRRFDHMQQHTAQHLLTAVAAERFGWATTSFHLGAASCDIELAAPLLPNARLAELEEAVATAIRAAHPVRAERVEAGDPRALAARSRGLPEGFSGTVRIVEIEGFDRSTCGGTHVASTAEIETLKLLGTEPMRGGTRLYWIAGGRVRRRLAVHEARQAELRQLFGAADDELVAIAGKKLADLAAAERVARQLRERLLEHELVRLAAAPGAFVAEEVPDFDATSLPRLAAQLAARRPDRLLLLCVPAAEGRAFVLAAGVSAGLDLPALGRRFADALGARGGGSKALFQGRLPQGVDFATARRKLAELLAPSANEPPC